jgi:hypothetical protein
MGGVCPLECRAFVPPNSLLSESESDSQDLGERLICIHVLRRMHSCHQETDFSQITDPFYNTGSTPSRLHQVVRTYG